MLAWEADSYSGVIYEEMISTCNETVQNANPTRYPSDFKFRMELDDLRCQDDVEDWHEELELTLIHQKASRERFEEFSEPKEESLQDDQVDESSID